MAIIRIEGPAAEPVSLNEMKAVLRVDYEDEDDLIQHYISAARQRLEKRCARAFVEQTWELRAAGFEDTIELPLPPTVGLVSVTYFDTDNVEQTVDPADYAFIEGGEESASSVVWVGSKPTGLAERPDAARVRFTAGWPADYDESPVDYAANVPWDIREAVKLTAAALFELRQDILLTPTRQEIAPLPIGAEQYIAPYVVMRL